MYCQKCGMQAPDGSKFCQRCGNPLTSAAVSGSAAPQARSAPQKRTEREPSPTPVPMRILLTVIGLVILLAAAGSLLVTLFGDTTGVTIVSVTRKTRDNDRGWAWDVEYTFTVKGKTYRGAHTLNDPGDNGISASDFRVKYFPPFPRINRLVKRGSGFDANASGILLFVCGAPLGVVLLKIALSPNRSKKRGQRNM